MGNPATSTLPPRGTTRLKAVNKVPAPALAEAAGSLSEQLLAFLGRLAALLQPESGWLEMRFLEQLETLGFEPRQRAALVYLTAGAAARVLGSGGSPAQFLDQVEYHGRRLAKLNLTPSDIVLALREYEDLLAPLLKRKSPAESANFEGVREHIDQGTATSSRRRPSRDVAMRPRR